LVRPNGANINHKGITPDQKVTLSDTDAAAGNDAQLKAAEGYSINNVHLSLPLEH